MFIYIIFALYSIGIEPGTVHKLRRVLSNRGQDGRDVVRSFREPVRRRASVTSSASSDRGETLHMSRVM